MSVVEAMQSSHGSSRTGSLPPRIAPKRRSSGLAWLLLLVLVVAGVLFGRTVLSAIVPESENSAMNYQVHAVRREPMRITVTEDGNVESANNEDIKCQVEGGSTILWIVEEGSTVAKGDKLVELDAAAIQEKLTQQRIVNAKAQSTYIQAQSTFEIAEIAVKEYLEGNFKESLQRAEAAIVVAEQNLKSAENMLQHSDNVFRKGYITKLQLESNRDAVDRAKLDLDVAKTARDVLTEFTKAKTLKELESKRDAAKEAMEAEKAAADLEKSKLDRLEEQLKFCAITAPKAGMVIYANDRSRRSRSEGALIEEGAQVRERQIIIRLPDLDQLQIRVLVHETKVDRIRPGLQADIRIRDIHLIGEVVSVATQPEPGQWFQSNVKQYAVVAKITSDTHGLGIKPGMTAEVEILAQEIPSALTVPLLGVVEQGGRFFCYVKKGPSYEKRQVVVGASNDKVMEIKDGLNEGDEVILNPRSTIADARQVFEKPAAARGANGNAVEKQAGGPGTPAGSPPGGPPGSPPPNGAALQPKGAVPAGPAGEADKKPADDKSKAKAKKKGLDLFANDKDGDGKISQDEAPEFMKQFFPNMDTNKDGFVDRSEAAAAQRRFQQKNKTAEP